MFHKLAPSTTMDAADVNDNFYWIAQGSIEPKDSSGVMSLRTKTYDLGSNLYKWNVFYCNNIDAVDAYTTSANSSYRIIADYILTDTASSIQISGLNGDQHLNYEMIIRGYVVDCNAGTTTIYFIYNQDSTTTNRIQSIRINYTSGSAGVYSERDAIVYHELINISTNTGSFMASIRSNVYSNRTKTSIISGCAYNSGTVISTYDDSVNLWYNTDETVTSVTFFPGSGKFATGTHIIIWGTE